MHRRGVDALVACALGSVASWGCAEVGDREGTCYADDHCPEGLVCSEQGLCEEPVLLPFDEDIKLDVGSDDEPEIPATCAEASVTRTNAGCEFWAADLPNAWLPGNPYVYDIAADQQFAVVVANVSVTDVATVTVHSGGSSQSLDRAEVGPLRTHAFDLPAMSVDPTSNGGGRAYRIESDVPITAYQFQPLDNLVPVYSNDASALLPSHVLEADYMAMTGSATQISLYPEGFDEVAYNAGAFVTAVGVEDGTHVVFYPTAELAPGAWSGVVLDRGDLFTIVSDVFTAGPGSLDPTGSLSGTRVIADKPIALFSGNVITGEPIGSDECCADHMEHQMLPLVAWGSSYVVAPAPDPHDLGSSDPTVIRVLASFDDTRLSYPTGRPTGAVDMLDAGQVTTFLTSDPVAIVSDPDHPIAVGQFLVSSGVANPGEHLGDPAFVALPSVGQFQSRYVFLSPNGYTSNIVNIVAPRGAQVELDGEAVGGWRSAAMVDGVSYEYARREIEAGAHVLVSDQPAGLTVFGYDRDVSYAYAGGSAVRKLSETPPIP